MRNLRLRLFSIFLIFFVVVALALPSPVHAANDSECVLTPQLTGPIYEGYQYTAVLEMKNTGTTTWSSSAGYKLGSQSPQDTTKWGPNRVELSDATTRTDPVDSKTIYRFAFTVTVNANPGTHTFAWKMVREPVSTYGWFGATCTTSVTVLPSPYTLYAPLLLKNHPAGYVPDSGKSTENSPYYSASNASEKQWTTVVVNNFDTANSAQIRVVMYGDNGTQLTNFTRTIAASGVWNSYGDTCASQPGTCWQTWNQNWVYGVNDRSGTADDSVVGWAKIVPIASTTSSTPSIVGQQRVTINEPATTNGDPSPGANHLMNDMNLITASASAQLHGGYFMRNWPGGYPNDGAVVQKTYMNFVNPNNSAANVTMKIYDTAGNLHHTVSKTIAAFGFWFSIGDSVWENIPFVEANSKVLQMAPSIRTPSSTSESTAKSCSLTLSSGQAVSPGSVTVNLSGTTGAGKTETFQLWVERQDGARIPTSAISPTATEVGSAVPYYYRLTSGDCTTTPGLFSSDCTSSTAVTLPVGSYYFHCDNNTAPVCSGNPFCTYEGGTTTCAGFQSCSATDNSVFLVYADNTTEANAPGGTAYNLLNTGTQSSGEGTYFADSTNFTNVRFDIAQAGAGVTRDIEYCSGVDASSNCNAWTDVSGLSDGTSNFTQDGTITWTDPTTSWTTGKVNGFSAKWLRIRSSTSPTTAPTAYYSTKNAKSLGWIEVSANKPIAGFNRTVAEKPSDSTGLRLLTDTPLMQTSSKKLYASLFIQNHSSGFTVPGTSTHIKQWSYILLHNPGSTSATATITVYSKTGVAATPFTKTLAANQTWYAKNDTNWNAVSPATDGWVEITSTAPLVGINRVSIGGESSTAHHYWTDYVLDTAGYKEAYATYFLRDHSSGYWESGVVQRSYPYIANLGASSATVRISVYAPGGGTPTAQWTETIAGRSTWAAISDTDWTGTGKIPASLTYGWVKFEVTAGDPVVGMSRVTFAKCTVGDTACTGTPGWLRIMTDAPLTTLPPPTLGVLNVVPDTATLAVQGPAYGRTGLRTTDSGSNFYNAIQVTQKVRDATTTNVSLVGSAFGATTGSPATLSDLKTNVDTNNGFILLYAANDTTHASGPTAATCDSGATANFCSGKYYVYRGVSSGGVWSTARDIGQTYGDESLGLIVVPRTSTNPVSAPNFSVTLYTAINNRNWTTYGYLRDVNGEEKSIVQRSCPATVSDPNSPSYGTTCF